MCLHIYKIYFALLSFCTYSYARENIHVVRNETRGNIYILLRIVNITVQHNSRGEIWGNFAKKLKQLHTSSHTLTHTKHTYTREYARALSLSDTHTYIPVLLNVGSLVLTCLHECMCTCVCETEGQRERMHVCVHWYARTQVCVWTRQGERVCGGGEHTYPDYTHLYICKCDIFTDMLENTPINACSHTHIIPYTRGLIRMCILHIYAKISAGVRGNVTYIRKDT